VKTFKADVSDEAQLINFRDFIAAEFNTSYINLLFNNAGVSGGGSFVSDDRREWDRTFAVTWGGVYNATRVFMPMILASDKGHVVNISSVNGFLASVGPDNTQTAYAAAKFAVKGFTEALIVDFRLNAPHVRASVVMPGHVSTSILATTSAAHGRSPADLTTAQIATVREKMIHRGADVSAASDDDIRHELEMQEARFRASAPTTAGEAAKAILAGVRGGSWRILVGDDARIADELVREIPEQAYDVDFMDKVRARGHFSVIETLGR
jgi:NAD(P)-dependent dehydrogenase (short-subunit alcohol dehydrogenase family)